jgi:nucleoside-diphosphate-sugar epimerase
MPRSYMPLSYSELLDDQTNSRASIASVTHYVSDEDRDVLILHTSGTTGLPKAIPQSHRYLLSYAPLTSFQFDDAWTLRDEQRMTFSTLPLFHCYGLLAPMFSLSIGKPFAIPPPGRVPTAAATVQFIRTVGASSLLVVPSLLEDIVNLPQETGMEALKELDYVKCGGGAIGHRIGAKLHTAGIKIATGFGSTEIGSLSVFRPPSTDSDWRFFRLREDRNCFVERMYISPSPDPPLHSISVRPPGWTEDHLVGDFFTTSRRHPGRDFCPIQRRDDVIVLATGEKVQPHVLETVLNENTAVRAALAFGVGRFSIGVLIEPACEVQRYDSFIDKIWPAIVVARNKTDAPGKIWSREQIILLKSGETLPRSAKGTVLREAAYEKYRKAIDQVYASLSSPTAISKAQLESTRGVGKVSEDDLEGRLLEYVARNLWSSYAPELDVEQDLILRGLDSQQAAQLHRFIVLEACRLPQIYTKAAEIPKDLVYRYPSISRISAYLRGDLTSFHDSREALTLKQLMQQVVVPSMPELKTFEFGSTVLLTGGTGSLGSHLLAHLASISTVERIICLNRRGGGKEPPLRQFESNSEKGACITSAAADKIQVLETDCTLPHLGLRPSTYKSLASSVTHIIHNAFQVDFLRRSDQFKDQYAIMSNLIQLGLACSSQVTFLFVSSVAVIGECGVASPATNSPVLIPEETFQHDWNMPRSGYGMAKLACEKMLEGAFKMHGLYSIIVRCGQVSGALKNGFWNSKEFFPTLFTRSRLVRALPNFDGVSLLQP